MANRTTAPIAPELITAAVSARFDASWGLDVETGCHVWCGSLGGHGYGRLSVGGRAYVAHRLAWVRASGKDVPEGLMVDHLCRNRACVNPAHLEAVTNRVNILRGTASGAGTMSSYAERGQCRKGHDLSSDDSWYQKKNGARMCLECSRERNRRSARAHADRKRAARAQNC